MRSKVWSGIAEPSHFDGGRIVMVSATLLFSAVACPGLALARDQAASEAAASQSASDVTDARYSAARASYAAGDYAAAEIGFREVIEALPTSMDPNSLFLILLKARLADTLGKLGRDEEAYRLMAESVASRRISQPDHPDLGFALAELSLYASNIGDNALAIALAMEGRDILLRSPDANPGNVGNAIQAVGMNLMLRGQNEEAERMFREGLVLVERAYGPTHRFTGLSLSLVAAAINAQGRRREALDYLVRAAVINNDPGSLAMMAAGVAQTGDYAQARRIYLEAARLGDYERPQATRDHAEYLMTLSGLSALEGDQTTAAELASRALPIARAVLPARSTVMNLYILSEALTQARLDPSADPKVALDEVIGILLHHWCQEATAAPDGAEPNVGSDACPGNQRLTSAVALRAGVRFRGQSSAPAAIRGFAHAGDMVLARTARRYRFSSEVREERAAFSTTHRDFITASWASHDSAAAGDIASRLRATYLAPAARRP